MRRRNGQRKLHAPEARSRREELNSNAAALRRFLAHINDPAFLALISDQQLRRYAITGRPDLGMPPWDGKAGRPPDFQPLTSEEIDGLVQLLTCWRLGGPAQGK